MDDLLQMNRPLRVYAEIISRPSVIVTDSKVKERVVDGVVDG